MQLSPHLTFDGQCRRAFEFYAELLGGNLSLISFAETPAAQEVPEAWLERIVHATLDLGTSKLAGADISPDDFVEPRGFYLLLEPQTIDEAENLFNALAEKGKVEMPLAETFWSPRFGVVVDRFGTPWEVSCAGNSEQEPS